VVAGAAGTSPRLFAQAKQVVKVGSASRADAPLGVLMAAFAQELDARGTTTTTCKSTQKRNTACCTTY
jgi:hypothetical protein